MDKSISVNRKTDRDDYDTSEYQSRGELLPIAIIQTIGVWIGCYALDYFVYPEIMYELWACRTGFIALMLIILMTIKTSIVQYNHFILTAFLFVSSSTTIGLMIELTNDSGTPYVLGLMVNSVVINLLNGLRRLEIIFYNTFNISVYLVVSIFFIETPLVHTMAITLVLHFLFVMNYALEQQKHAYQVGFDAFLKTKHQKESQEKIEKQKQDLELVNTQLVQQQDLLIQTAKVSMVGDMTMNIMHEIKNPLNIALSAVRYARHLELKNTSQEQYEDVLNDISVGIERIHKISKDMNSFSYQDTSRECSLVSLNTILTFSLQMLKGRIDDVQVVLPETDVTLFVAQNQLSQVFVNLFSNALFAFEQGQADKQIRIEVKKVDHTIEIIVTDNGCGVSETVQDNLFVPYFTTKGRSVGTGIGLRISRMIIEAHHGSLEFNGNNPGASFKISLPDRQLNPE